MFNRLLCCPYCKYSFRRRFHKLEGTTSCFKCRKRFNRNGAMVVGENRLKASQEVSARKAGHTIKNLPKIQDKIISNSIRGEQIPFSSSESRFKFKAMSKGWVTHRPSWPDYLLETEDGVIAVEVKSRNDILSTTQRQTFDLLESIGIKVYLWRDSKKERGKLVRWNNIRNENS